MQEEVIEENETSEENTTESNTGDVSSDENSSESEAVTTTEVQAEYIEHFEFIEQQLTGCICFMGVMLGAYLCKALFERFKA